MSEITLIVEFAIKPGMGDTFEAAAARMREKVARDEPGTLRYDWWLSADGTRDMNIEVFADSAALVRHMENTAPMPPDLVAAAEVVRVEVLGELSSEAHAAIDGAATGQFEFSGGIER